MTAVPSEEGGSKGLILRRTIHVFLALGLVYYLLPVELPWFGLRRWMLLIGFLALIGAIEYIRLRKNIIFYGLRSHEKDHIASFMWSAAGLVLVLWCFPHDVAAVAILGTAFIDPLMGELRRLRLSIELKAGLPFAAYLAMAIAVFWLSGHWALPQTLLLSVLGAVTGVISEWHKVHYVDDDFLMMVIPGAVMAWLTLAF